jgi:hypothetical protein
MASTARKLQSKSIIAQHMPRTVREVKNRPPCKQIAAERIYEFLWEIGADYKHEIGWKTRAAERAGLNYSTALSIINGDKETVGPDVVDQISIATGVPVGIFYDYEV